MKPCHAGGSLASRRWRRRRRGRCCLQRWRRLPLNGPGSIVVAMTTTHLSRAMKSTPPLSSSPLPPTLEAVLLSDAHHVVLLRFIGLIDSSRPIFEIKFKLLNFSCPFLLLSEVIDLKNADHLFSFIIRTKSDF